MHLIHFERFVPLHRIPPIFFRLNLKLLCILMTFGVHGVLLAHGFFFFFFFPTCVAPWRHSLGWMSSGGEQPAAVRRVSRPARGAREGEHDAVRRISVTLRHWSSLGFIFFFFARAFHLTESAWSLIDSFRIHAQPPVEHQWHGEKAPSSARPHYWPSSR